MITKKLDQIMVGSYLTSLVEAYAIGVPMIIKERPPYYFFDRIGDAAKGEVWSRFAFHLSMSGLLPCGGPVVSCRIDKDPGSRGGVVEVVDVNEVAYRFEVDKIEEKNPSQIMYPDKSGKTRKAFDMIDWFNVISGKVHEHEESAKWKERFVGRLIFPTTNNSKAEKPEKNVIAFSTILEEDILNDEYSELMARFEVERQMAELGIKGRKNGIAPNGKQKHLKLYIEHEKRVVRPKIRGEELVNIEQLIDWLSLGDLPDQIAESRRRYGDPLSICYGKY
jgi:hypothetical protein